METYSMNTSQIILKHLVYYDIFNYPLTIKELIDNCSLWDIKSDEAKAVIENLVNIGAIYKLNGFYSIRNNTENVDDRLKGNELARKWKKKADRFSRYISKFPFVRGVALSGSLSKGFLGEDPDIDYFIITQPGRLWLSRTFLVLFKKVFLWNSHKYFCVNYFIDSENLEIEEKNIFTATELATMIPTYGNIISHRFYSQNKWVLDYYPKFEGKLMYINKEKRKESIKKLLEALLNNSLGNYLDTQLMNLTHTYWNRKFRDSYSENDFQLIFKTSKGISKHHPQNFQKKVLNQYQMKLNELTEKFNFVFDKD